MLGKKVTKMSRSCKKKEIAPSIMALHEKLSRAMGALGSQLGATSQSAGHTQTMVKMALHQAQATKEESSQARLAINETLRMHFAHTTQATQEKLNKVASSLAHQLLLVTESLQRSLMQSHTA